MEAGRGVKAPRLSAGFVVVRCIAGRYHYLLLRAYRYWDFPKGLVEPDESPLAAARRETEEETGLERLELAWGEDYVETPPYRGNKVARYYLARSDSGDVVLGVNPALGRPEHHAYRWADYATAAPLLGPRVRAVLDWAHARIGERC
ncbi:MAG TPA: NUDIX domain-containing protein [Burkholderiales bacterium]